MSKQILIQKINVNNFDINIHVIYNYKIYIAYLLYVYRSDFLTCFGLIFLLWNNVRKPIHQKVKFRVKYTHIYVCYIYKFTTLCK